MNPAEDAKLEEEIKKNAASLAKAIRGAASSSNNEAEMRTKITALIDDVAERLRLKLSLREEYTLINGRADAVYNRLVIEYEPPFCLRESNSYGANKHAIEQVKKYMEELSRRERHRSERLAGVVLDGNYFIFARKKEGLWYIDDPLIVNDFSTERFLKLLASLSTELALIPENLVRDFGENTRVARQMVSALFNSLKSATDPKVRTLFEQWSLQFSEVCDYEKASKTNVDAFARKFALTERVGSPFLFFFCLHTYYALFIKLLAVQVVHYYLMPKLGTDLKRAATYDEGTLRSYLEQLEDGGIFKQLGIGNFIEGDFFSWYLDVWNDTIYASARELISTLANYSLVTLDVDPDTTRDLLKKLYQQLMPRVLRHNLGEYYTPDWLAENLLNRLDGGVFRGDPNKRILDPACGSGTFLVLAIKKIKDFAWKNAIPESRILEKILANVVGFDLNPLAVISARTNYLLALGDLLQHRTEEINIPVYICDSIVTPQEGESLFEHDKVRINTAVGYFEVPNSLVEASYIDNLADFLEEAVKLNLDRGQFIESLCRRLPLDPEADDRDVEIVFALYEKLLSLERQGRNGIWARIIKNAFAPLFVGEFDFIVGNPPWVNWESLPEQYRQASIPLWQKYGLFPHGGMDTILGKGKKDISMLMTYVAMDKYLKNRGKLGFVITQSLFKTSGSGQGFRRFKLGEDGPYIRPIQVDDMVELNPFEGASNRTSIVILQKGLPPKYPVEYLYWKKSRGSIPLEATLSDVLKRTERKQFKAEPVNESDPTSSWLTGRPKALKAVRKILGPSDYVAHEGCNSGGANGVYWVEIIEERKDGLIVISNITEHRQRKVESVQAAIEPDLIYPLLRGRDVKKWHAKPSAYIIMAQDKITRRGIDEDEMKQRYPKTYMYLKRFEDDLRKRAAFKRYFTRKSKGKIIETGSFYSMFNVGEYTFAPYKVVWREQASSLTSAAIGVFEGKAIVPDHKLMLIAVSSKAEAFYLSGMLNSSPSKYAAISYAVGIQFNPHILENIAIPKFDPSDSIHLLLKNKSEEAHRLNGEGDSIAELESEIDELTAKIWGLSKQELKDIQLSLEELS